MSVEYIGLVLLTRDEWNKNLSNFHIFYQKIGIVNVKLPRGRVLRRVLLPTAVAAALAAASNGRHDHLGRVGLVVRAVQEQRHGEVQRVDLELLVLEHLAMVQQELGSPIQLKTVTNKLD